MNDRESVEFMKRVLEVQKDCDLLKARLVVLSEEMAADMLKRGVKVEAR